MNHRPGSPPGALAPLYGREHDLHQLLKMLHAGVRLLTLRGPGGYRPAHALPDAQVLVMTPAPTITALRAGYRPAIHL